MKKLIFLTLFIFIFQQVFAINILYRFFPIVDDNSAIQSIQPSALWLNKYEIQFKVARYENLPAFEKVLVELWKKLPDGNYENTDNIVFTKDKIKQKGDSSLMEEELKPLSEITDWQNLYKEFITFKKIEIPYYKKDNLEKTYFDVSFKSMNIIHKVSSDWKVYPIKIIKKNYAKADEAQLTLPIPDNINNINESDIIYYIDLPTDKLPYSVRQYLSKRQFDHLYIRDPKQRFYDFVILNKYQFGLSYSSDYPTAITYCVKTDSNGNCTKWQKKNIPSDPARNNFIKLWNAYYYFSDLGYWTPTENDIETMVETCRYKWWKNDSWFTIYNGSKTVLDYFISENSNRKAYGIFTIRICKKEDPLYPILRIAIKIPKSNMLDFTGNMILYIWSVKNTSSNLSKVYYNDIATNVFSGYEYTLAKTKIVPIIKPVEVLIFDEQLAGITPKENDKIVLDVLANKIYYYKWDPDWKRYLDPVEYLPYSVISKDILIESKPDTQYKVTVNKIVEPFSLILDMSKYDYGDYMLKLTPIYADNYYIKFKAVNKCYPDLLQDTDILTNPYIVDSSWKLIENHISDILKWKDELFNLIVNKWYFTNVLLYQDKLTEACKNISKYSDIADEVNQYLQDVGAKTSAKIFKLQQICYWLINNGKYLDVKNWTKINFKLPSDKLLDIKSLEIQVTPKDKTILSDWSFASNYNNIIVDDKKWSYDINYICYFQDKDWKIWQKKIYEKVWLLYLNKLAKENYTGYLPYNADSLRYFYSY